MAAKKVIKISTLQVMPHYPEPTLRECASSLKSKLPSKTHEIEAYVLDLETQMGAGPGIALQEAKLSLLSHFSPANEGKASPRHKSGKNTKKVFRK